MSLDFPGPSAPRPQPGAAAPTAANGSPAPPGPHIGGPPWSTVSFAGLPVKFRAYTRSDLTSMQRGLDRLSEDFPQYGAWASMEQAEKAIMDAFSQYGAEIQAWAYFPDNFPFIREIELPYPVGWVLTREEEALAAAENRTPEIVATNTFRFRLSQSPMPPYFKIDRVEPVPPLPDHGVDQQPLPAYEGEGPGRGHSIKRHADIDVAEAVERLDRESFIPASGAFYSEAIQQRAVSTMIDAFGREIAGWLKNSTDRMPFTREYIFAEGDDVGWMITRDSLDHQRSVNPRLKNRDVQPISVRGARLVLRKSDDYPEGYYVVTAYPIRPIRNWNG